MGANKQISCKICSKVMRSDNLSRHMHKHLPNNDHLSKDIDKEVASKNTDVYELHKPLTHEIDKYNSI